MGYRRSPTGTVAQYPLAVHAVIQVTDPDENTYDSSVTDTFKVAVYSDSDNGGFTCHHERD